MLTPTVHAALASVSRGLDRQSPAMKLFEKAKKYGIWNPSLLDLTQDQRDWAGLSAQEQSLILRLTAMFQAGEEAVTLDLLPLIMVIAQEGRIEEEMFLTTFLWEEAKHTDFFRRFLDEVTHNQTDLSPLTVSNYRTVVYDALPVALGALVSDPSPRAQVIASVTYNMIVEGVLAETGYYAYHSMLQRNGLMPGTCKGIMHLKQDESRHIAYGIYLISRLIAHDDSLWEVAEAEMNRLLMPSLGVITEIFDCYEVVPFGLQVDEFMNYALMQYQKRYNRLLACRGKNLADVNAMTHDAIETDNA
jgi:ribonucleoside-diphosphate reductase beta chain